MDLFMLDEDESYERVCGEIFLTTKKNIAFHCTICEVIYKNYESYVEHLHEYHLSIKTLKDFLNEEDAIGIDEENDYEEIANDNINEKNTNEANAETDDDNLEFDENQIELSENELKDVLSIGSMADSSSLVRYEIESAENLLEDNNIKSQAQEQSSIEDSSFDRPFACQLCPSKFAHKFTLVNHMKLHEDKREYKCKVCNEAYNQKAGLVSHLKFNHKYTNEDIRREYPRPRRRRTFGKYEIITSENTLNEDELTNNSSMDMSEQAEMEENDSSTVHTTRKNRGKYECEFCDMAFNDIDSFRSHEMDHPLDRPFTCNICSSHFARKDTLRNHIKIHENKREYKCKSCGEGYNHKVSLISHLQRFHKYTTEEIKRDYPRPKRRRTCAKYEIKISENTFEDEGNSGQHNMDDNVSRNDNLAETDQRKYKCGFCDMRFNDHDALQNHTMEHSFERPFTCNLCGTSFARKDTLRNHKKIHENKREYKCSLCGEGYNQNSALVSHMRCTHRLTKEEIHTLKAKSLSAQELKDSEIPIETLIEDTEFPDTNDHEYLSQFQITFPVREVRSIKRNLSNSKIATNIPSIDDDETRPFKCPICNAGFKSKHILKYHFKRHSSEKDRECPDCGKKFHTNTEVRLHLGTHTGEKSHLCIHCGRSFSRSSYLLYHMNRHTDQTRNFKCNICDKAFFDKRTLANHMFSHSSERPFGCDICSARFTRKTALQNHIKLHENKREYKCKLCTAGFNQKAGLLSHMKMTHKIM